MLKCQLHTHCHGDPVDNIKHTAKELIDEAARLKYDVLCITCHRKLFFNKKLQKYAQKKSILLIPGIEFEINKKHILGINIDKEITEVDSYQRLAEYKKSHPDSLIIAPHPFFPTNYCLKNDLINNIRLFDAIEISWAYTKTKNYNQKAIDLAKRWGKPLITSSDCHILKYLNIGYTMIKSQKNTLSLIEAIRSNKIQIISKPTSYFKIARFMVQMNWQNLRKR